MIRKKKQMLRVLAGTCSIAIAASIMVPIPAAQSFARDAVYAENEAELDQEFESMLDEQGFPESYRAYLRQLHSQYPAWNFEAVHTGLSFSEAVAAESVTGRNLVDNGNISSWKSGELDAYNWKNSSSDQWYYFDSGNWVGASKELIQYYMDPRNFLNEDEVYQFETLELKDYHNMQGVATMLAGTFMGGGYIDSDGIGRIYADTFMEAAIQSNVNPYHLAARCHQELGSSGSSNSISGTVAGLENLYNYFNIGAYKNGNNSATTSGLLYAAGTDEAYFRPWVTRYRAILGGAKYLSEKYIKVNQDTLYFQKFNVVNTDNGGLYKHQYMTNVQAAWAEGMKLKKAYVNLAETPLAFRIPVYEEMPAEPCEVPIEDGSPNNVLSDLKIEGETVTPAFSPLVKNYSLQVSEQVEQIHVTAGTFSSKAQISGDGKIALEKGVNSIKITCTAENGSKRTYFINVTRGSKEAGAENKKQPKVFDVNEASDETEPDMELEVSDQAVQFPAEGAEDRDTKEQQPVKGDRKKGITYTNLDLLYIEKYLSGKLDADKMDFKRFDLNQDGAVTDEDGIMLKQSILQKQ